MERTMLMHTALRCPYDTLSTDIWPTEIDYSVWVYNQIHEPGNAIFILPDKKPREAKGALNPAMILSDSYFVCYANEGGRCVGGNFVDARTDHN